MLCTAAINTSNRPVPPNANPLVWILTLDYDGGAVSDTAICLSRRAYKTYL